MILFPSIFADIDWRRPVNWGHPLNRGLSAWWLVVPQFSGGQGFIDLCQRNDATIEGLTPSSVWTGPRGRTGGFGAVTADDAGRFNVNTTLGNFGDDDFTLMAWFRNTSASNPAEAILGKNDWGANKWMWYVHSSGVLRFATDGSFGLSVGSGLWQDDTWHHGAFARVGDSANSYLEGGAESSTDATYFAATATLSNANMLTIGDADARNSVEFTGPLDDVRIYSGRGLTANEIADYYRLSRNGYPGLLNRARTLQFEAPAGGGTNPRLIRRGENYTPLTGGLAF